MNKVETTNELQNFISFNKEDIDKLYTNYPVLATAFENVINAISEEYGSGKKFEYEPVIEKDRLYEVGDYIVVLDTGGTYQTASGAPLVGVIGQVVRVEKGVLYKQVIEFTSGDDLFRMATESETTSKKYVRFANPVEIEMYKSVKKEDLLELKKKFSSSPIIENLPSPIKKLALNNQVAQGFNPNEKLYLNATATQSNFSWEKSPQGYDFWMEIYKNDWDIYYDNPSKWEAKEVKKADPSKPAIDVNNPKSLVGYTLVFMGSKREFLVISFLRNNPKNKRFEVENLENKQRIKYDIAMTLITKILSGQKAGGLYVKELQPEYSSQFVKTQTAIQKSENKLNVETIPATLRFGVKFLENKGDRNSPTQSAGDLYRGYNSAKEVSEELLKSYFKGNDGLWYQLVERGNSWAWKKASPQPITEEVDLYKLTQPELVKKESEILEALKSFEEEDPEYEELKLELEQIRLLID